MGLDGLINQGGNISNKLQNFCTLVANGIRWDRPGTSIKRGGHGGSVKCQNSNLQQFFQVDYVI
jgi:hypothetical protein